VQLKLQLQSATFTHVAHVPLQQMHRCHLRRGKAAHMHISTPFWENKNNPETGANGSRRTERNSHKIISNIEGS